MKYIVNCSYNISVEADNEIDAEIRAQEEWADIMPRQDEMNYTVEKEV